MNSFKFDDCMVVKLYLCMLIIVLFINSIKLVSMGCNY